MRRLLFLMPILLCAAVSAHAQSLDAFKQRLAEPTPGATLFNRAQVTVTEHDDALDQVYDELETLDQDVDDIVSDLYADDDDEDEDDEDDDEEYFETTCPVCEEEIVFDEDTLESGEIRCPNCGEKLEFDLTDLAEAKGEDDED